MNLSQMRLAMGLITKGPEIMKVKGEGGYWELVTYDFLIIKAGVLREGSIYYRAERDG